MRIVDTHLHLWDPGLIPCSWCAGIPLLNRAFDLSDYETASRGAGITQAVFVEADVDEPHAAREARHIQAIADANPLVAGIVASARPERADFAAQLEELLPLSKLRGLRRVLHVVPDELSRTALFAENLRRLPEHGLTFDLCVLARQLPLAFDLARRCPEVGFVLDHCGVPDIRAGLSDPWRADLRAIAALPNIVCKISGLPAYAGTEGATVETLRPWVEHTFECFGPDRVLWGGDWPVCTLATSLGQWVDITRTLTRSFSGDDRAKFFHLNAERIYRV